MIIKPLNHVILAEKISSEKKETGVAGIYLPDQQEGRFIKLKVFAVGNLVDNIKAGDVVYANPLLEVIDPANKNVGFIKSTDVMAILKDESN